MSRVYVKSFLECVIFYKRLTLTATCMLSQRFYIAYINHVEDLHGKDHFHKMDFGFA